MRTRRVRVVESSSLSFRTVLIALHRSILVNEWFDEQVMHPHEQYAAWDFSGCNFVDASIVGCV